MIRSKDRTRRHIRPLIAVGVAFILVAAGCSDDSGDGGGASSAPSAPASTAAAPTPTDSAPPETDATSALGEPNPATGSPITIGVMSEAGGGTLDAQAALGEKGVSIAQQYVNEYLGGINGHKLDVFVCDTKVTPAGAQDCANQFIEKGVSAVVYSTGSQGSHVPILTAAGIPIIAGNGSSNEELTTPGVFILTGGYPGNLGAFAVDARDRGIKKFANIVIDVPAATGAAQALGSIVFGNMGVDYEVITAPPGTPDLTPQLQQAVSSGADALMATGDLTFCTSFFQAYDTLQLTATKYVVVTCNDPTVVQALPNALKGALQPTLTASGPDTELYAAMVKKYGDDSINPDPTLSSGVAGGVSSIMNFVNALQGYTGDGSAASILEHMKGATGQLFLSGGLGFKCDGTAIPILPNICSAEFQLAVLNGDGTIASTSPVDAAEAFAS